MQAVLTVQALPDDAIDAAARFFRDNLDRLETLVAERPVAIAIVLPEAGPDHDHWRRALARDLGRKYAPVRVNVVGAADPAATEALLHYLGGAPGITGQYCPAHG
jgi:hypothetical protein